jgi:hypothetical protein
LRAASLCFILLDWMRQSRLNVATVRNALAEVRVVVWEHDARVDDHPRRLWLRAGLLGGVAVLALGGSLSLLVGASSSVFLGVGAALGAIATGAQAVRSITRARRLGGGRGSLPPVSP